MTFDECMKRLSDMSASISVEDVSDADIQVNIIGNDNGIFHLHIADGKMTVCNGECKGRNTQCIFTLPALKRILDGVIDPVYAYTTGKFKMTGDINLGRTVLTKLYLNK